MSTRIVGLIVAIAGLLIGLFFTLADVLGVGQSPDMFGTTQIIGTVGGVVILGAGIVLAP